MSASTPLLNTTSSDKQRLLSALTSAQRNAELESDQLLPAQVVTFDRINNIAVIQPLIKWVDIADGLHSRDQLASINVLSIGGGGFHISFPLNPGDLGWILASDRDISLFKQSLQESPPNTGRLHSFSDAWFIPDVFRQYTMNADNANAMLIESVDGTTSITIKEGIVNIIAPTSVTVTTPIATFTGNVVIQQNLTVDQNATIDQNLTVQQNANVNATLTATGGATLPSNATAGGTTLTSHGHISGAPGSRTSGGMIS